MNISQPALQLCYENVNWSCIKTPYSAGSVFGNLLVIISVLHFKQLHSPANFLITSLACADFLVGIAVMPFSMVRSVESCWYFGAKFCTLHRCCDAAFCYSSLFHLCFISMHRYMAVTDPLVYPTKFTVSVSGICIAVSWILPMMFFGAVIYTGVNDDGMESLVSALNCVGGCQIVVNQDGVLIDFSLIFHTYPCYVAKRERKAATILGVTVVAFTVSWLPYTMETIIDAFMGFITPAYIYEICCWCAYYNSAVNPLIYGLFYPWFRKAIEVILSGEILKDSSSTMSLFSE
uniref:Trace amine-associated receptor 8a-like n=1 Tax=Chinchilla lanigera TaxID=34839 RepID=A0A8C2VNV4_CHILA